MEVLLNVIRKLFLTANWGAFGLLILLSLSVSFSIYESEKGKHQTVNPSGSSLVPLEKKRTYNSAGRTEMDRLIQPPLNYNKSSSLKIIPNSAQTDYKNSWWYSFIRPFYKNPDTQFFIIIAAVFAVLACGFHCLINWIFQDP